MVKILKGSTFSLSQKISKEDSIVWLKNSNKYIILNSKILELIKDKLSLSSKDFLLEITESLNVTSSIAKKIDNDISELLLETKQIKLKPVQEHTSKVKDCKMIHHYYFNDTCVKICLDSEETKALIHPKYSHLAIANTKNCDVEFKIFNSDKKLVIFKNDQFVGSWDNTELHEFQGKFSMELMCSFYNKAEHDWMGVFHASTISRDNRSIMFTGDSGNGKSTLVSILMDNGFNVIADDFTPILREDFKTYCFPSAISIKEKSYSLMEHIYPGLKNSKQYYISELKGAVKYLPPTSKETSAKCSSVVWVKYSKSSENSIKNISTQEALKKILPDAWISDKEANAKAFLVWIKRTNFYELNYSDNNELISIIDTNFY